MRMILIEMLILIQAFVGHAKAQGTTENIRFDKIIVSSGIQLQILRSDGYAIEIKTQEVDDDCLIRTLEEGTLTLKLVNRFGCAGKVAIDISCPSLKELEVIGKAEVATENVMTGDSLIISMRSGGKAYIDLDIKYLNAKLSEGAMARFEGYAIDQILSVSTSSTFSGWELEGENVIVKAASGAIVKVHASGNIQATAGSGGYIGIKGNPENKLIDSKSNGEIEILDE